MPQGPCASVPLGLGHSSSSVCPEFTQITAPVASCWSVLPWPSLKQLCSLSVTLSSLCFIFLDSTLITLLYSVAHTRMQALGGQSSFLCFILYYISSMQNNSWRITETQIIVEWINTPGTKALHLFKRSPGGSGVENPPATQETQVRSLGREDPLEKEMATHSSMLAWEVPRRSLEGYSP